MTKPDWIDIKKIRGLIKGEIGREIICAETVESTNTLAIDLCAGNDKKTLHGTVVLAGNQTKGRGRFGRVWASPPGKNIYMSIILKASVEPKETAVLTLMAAVACARAISNATGLKIRIKWPNDLLVSGKKTGGILTESRTVKGRIAFAVTGIGVNVNSAPEDFPPGIRETAASLKSAAGGEQSIEGLVSGILNELSLWYGLLVNNGREAVLKEWKALTSTLGRPVSIAAGKEVLTGIAEDIDSEGALLLRLSSGKMERVIAGEVTHLRETEQRPEREEQSLPAVTGS